MLHNSMTDLKKVKSNLEAALDSQLLLMGQNSGRAGQFAPQFVSIAEAIDKVDWLIRDAENAAKAEAKATKSQKQDT